MDFALYDLFNGTTVHTRAGFVKAVDATTVDNHIKRYAINFQDAVWDKRHIPRTVTQLGADELEFTVRGKKITAEVTIEPVPSPLLSLSFLALHIFFLFSTISPPPLLLSISSTLSLTQFHKSFSNYSNCFSFIFKLRYPYIFFCPACFKRRFATLKSLPLLYKYLYCVRQTSVTAFTAIHLSSLPLTTCFYASHLITPHSNIISALQLQDQLIVTYKTAWLLHTSSSLDILSISRASINVFEIYQTEIPFRESILSLRAQHLTNPLHRTIEVI